MQINIYEKYKQLADIFKFGINALLLGIFWIVFYKVFKNFEIVKNFYEIASEGFTNFLTHSCKIFLNILGYDVEILGKTIRITGSSGVYLDKGCLARNLMGLYAGFIIAYPGKITKKLWFVPLGLVIINILNIFRLSGLAILSECCPEKVEFNHHYVFKIVVFAFTLFLWYLWVFKMNNTEKKEI